MDDERGGKRGTGVTSLLTNIILFYDTIVMPVTMVVVGITVAAVYHFLICAGA